MGGREEREEMGREKWGRIEASGIVWENRTRKMGSVKENNNVVFMASYISRNLSFFKVCFLPVLFIL